MRFLPISAIGIMVFFISCVNHFGEDGFTSIDTQTICKPKYAEQFAYQPTPNGYMLHVFNPWQGADNVRYSYILDSTLAKSSTKNAMHITLPVKRAICLSTTHIAFIDRLSKLECIVGVSGINLSSNPGIHALYSQGKLHDIGYEQALNYEVIASLRPDVVFAYGVGAEMTGYTQKLKELGIPVVFIADYLENTPLGKAEWIKAFSLFFDQLERTDSIFSDIEQKYVQLKGSIVFGDDKPSVFFNLPWKDIWYLPGNENYMIEFVRDAGGEYVMNHLQGKSSSPFSTEAALSYAITADVWLNTGSANSLADLRQQLPVANSFKSVVNHRVYNNNNLQGPSGGNDFWESGVVNPHLILADLLKIFYPDSISSELVYYKKLE